jgi:hypothetical protein
MRGRAAQVAGQIEPSNHVLYPNKSFTVVNHTPHPACLLVYPAANKFRTRPSHLQLRADCDGVAVAVCAVQVPNHTRSHRGAWTA